MGVYFAQYGAAWTLRGYKLVDRVTGQYKVTPTLAAGDFKIEKDGGAATNLATLPVIEPAAGSSISIALSATEMQCAQAVINLVDGVGNEWNDDCIHVFTVGSPNAYFQFNFFTASVAVSAASASGIQSGVWEELRNNHRNAGTLGESVNGVVGDVTGNVTGNVGGNVGGNVTGNVMGYVSSIAASGITAASLAAGALTDTAVAPSAGQKIADEILNRNLVGGASGGSRNIRNALRTLRNRVRVNGPSLEVYQEDDSTLAWTAATTTSASNPITEIDPA